MQTALSSLQTGHVGINVTDLTRSKAFYQAVFGLTVSHESAEADRTFAFLANGDQLVLTLWQQSTGQFEKSRPGLHHLSFQVADIDAVQEAERRVRDQGTPLYHDGIVPHSEGITSGGIFFEDPDGTRLEIFAPSGVSGKAPTQDAPTCGFF